jgi:hypothetical protein
MKRFLLAFLMIISVSACKTPERSQNNSLSDIASQYVKLALEIGQYDSDFIDAYYGPERWDKKPKDGAVLPYEELKWKTNSLINHLISIDDMGFNELELLRYQFLNKQLQAMHTKLEMLAGKKYPFDVESLRLYDAVAPRRPMTVYDSLLARLNILVPGEGDLSSRYAEYSKHFIIPQEKLDEVFQAAIDEARKRVKEHIELPKNESFEIEYVTGKPWSGYNWFKGKAHSLIQINTDFPIYIDRAIDLACHEGYPGHHVFNAMLEKNLVDERHWHEFQVYPLFSPQSFIAEGTANYGIEMAFSNSERITFEKNVLFPLAGLNPAKVEEYYEIQSLRKELKAAGIDIARSYLNMEIDEDTAIHYLVKYLQYSPSRAEQRLSFYNRYRSYIINYSLGEALIRKHLEEQKDAGRDKWDLFNVLLTTPRTASTL